MTYRKKIKPEAYKKISHRDTLPHNVRAAKWTNVSRSEDKLLSEWKCHTRGRAQLDIEAGAVIRLNSVPSCVQHTLSTPSNIQKTLHTNILQLRRGVAITQCFISDIRTRILPPRNDLLDQGAVLCNLAASGVRRSHLFTRQSRFTSLHFYPLFSAVISFFMNREWRARRSIAKEENFCGTNL